MSLLICTPAYGGQVTLAYMNSCLMLKEELLKAGVEHDWLTMMDESEIIRGRNVMATTFLNDTNYERMLFIDADIEYTPEDVSKLWNMDVDVAVAAYPMKRADRPPLSAWEKGKLVEIDGRTEPFEAEYAGTGFMMIKRKVFQTIRTKHPELRVLESKGLEPGAGDCWGFFDKVTVHYGDDKISLPEDFSFCHRWRSLGGKIMLDPTIRLKHWGSWCYAG